YVREKVSRLYDPEKGAGMRILYGGSVKPGNALELFQMENIDGGLIGGASLKGADFNAIIEAGIEASG
ncbi:Triosephosphate isomerase, partial [hydrothermal vent metagenome]